MVVNVGGASTASGATTAAGTSGTGGAATPAARVTSSFAIQQGYAVELETLPGAVGHRGERRRGRKPRPSTRRDRGRPASSQADFKITPAPPAGDYVIYSGQYHTSAQATSALAKLKRAFAARQGDRGPPGRQLRADPGAVHDLVRVRASGLRVRS